MSSQRKPLHPLRRLGVPAVLLCLLTLNGCKPMADESLCEQVYQHRFNLKHADEPESVKKVKADRDTERHMEFLNACVDKETEKRMQCFLSSDSLERMNKDCKNGD